VPTETTVQRFADFALKARWEDLPESIVQETKMLLMDSIGCALVPPGLQKARPIYLWRNASGDRLKLQLSAAT